MLTALLRRHPRPDAMLVREALAGNICRCTGYAQIIEAAQSVIDKRREST
jgi:carbon-monoxide dehydrogenase small subunit